MIRFYYIYGYVCFYHNLFRKRAHLTAIDRTTIKKLCSSAFTQFCWVIKIVKATISVLHVS